MPSKRRTWTRQTILDEIRRLHRLRHPLTSTAAPRSLYKAAEYHLGSWRVAIETAGFDYDSIRAVPAPSTDAELLDRLRTTAREHPALTLGELDRIVPVNTLKSHFGSWQNAVARAGLNDWPTHRRRWTERMILTRLKELYSSGRTANDDPKVYAAAKSHFGSLAAACATIGVELKIGRAWSRDEVVDLLRRLERDHGLVTIALVEEAGAKHAIAAHFGGIKSACKQLGLSSVYTQRLREYAALDDRREALRRLRRFAKQHGRPVTAAALPAALRDALLRLFGTIESARHAAGLRAPVPQRKWDRALALAELQREHARGTRLTLSGLLDAGRKDLTHAVNEHIGSLPAARRLAGLPEPAPLPRKHVPFQKEWDEDRVLDEILGRATDGQSLAPSRIPRPLYGAATRYLGSWREAVEAAGFEYNAVVLNRPFEDGELLAILRKLAVERPDMTVTELQHEPIATSLHRWFGGYESAVRRAGIRDWPVRINVPRLPRSEIREALQARLASGRSIERVHVTEDEPKLAYAVRMIHPDWTEAIARLELGRATRRRGPP